MNITHLRLHVVRPTLEHIQLWSPAAENLVVGTAIVESGAMFLRQIGGGPALGLWQMEPATHDDLWKSYLLARSRADLRARIRELETKAAITAGAAELVGNLYYAAAMCRVHYRRVPEALPAADDAYGLATYWKRYYNTPAGKGTVEYARACFHETCVNAAA